MISLQWKKAFNFSWLRITMMKDMLFLGAEVQYILRFWTNFSVMVTDNEVCNEVTHFSRLQVIEKDVVPDSDFLFQLALCCSSPVVFCGVEFAHITPAHLHKLKQGNVIHLLPLVVPFSWLFEITANINRGYKKGLWTLERVDYAMNQFINGGPWSSVGVWGIYSFIKQCLQHLSSLESRPLKRNKAP